jgi:hypothetical protein
MFHVSMARRKGNAPIDDLFDLLESIVSIVQAWVSIPFGIVGGLVFASLLPK